MVGGSGGPWGPPVGEEASLAQNLVSRDLTQNEATMACEVVPLESEKGCFEHSRDACELQVLSVGALGDQCDRLHGTLWVEGKLLAVRRQGQALAFADVEVACQRKAEEMTEAILGEAADAPVLEGDPDLAAAAPPAAAAASDEAARSQVRRGGRCRVQLVLSAAEYWSSPSFGSCEPPRTAATPTLAPASARESVATLGHATPVIAGFTETAGTTAAGVEAETVRAKGIPLPCALELLKRAQSLRVLSTATHANSRGTPTLTVRLVLRVEAVPDFFAFSRVESLWRRGILSDSQAAAAFGSSVKILEALKCATPREAKLILKAAARRAAGLRLFRENRRQKLTKDEEALLLQLEPLRVAWPIHPTAPVDVSAKGGPSEESPKVSGVEEGSRMSLALATLVDLPEDKQTMDRVEWVLKKKLPQVEWLVAQIKEMYDAKAQRAAAMSDPWTFNCVDVGGGRGLLALALAEALPKAEVRVIDNHAPSIEALKTLLQDERMTRIKPIHADFAELQNDLGFPDVLVALHACGGLSDAVIASAVKHRCSFLMAVDTHIKGGPCPHRQAPNTCPVPLPQPEASVVGAKASGGKSSALGAPGAAAVARVRANVEGLEEASSELPQGACQELQTLFRLADSTDPTVGLQAMWAALAWRASVAVCLANTPEPDEEVRPNEGTPQGPSAASLHCRLLSFPSSLSQKNLVLLGTFSPRGSASQEAPKGLSDRAP
ncbi:methyltransferase domain-containing protein [Cyclospora cayetanensis]|uniref:Methyltransferase domain-containing protein n=1 Tax=Cyclospora cayetanensis TaxID=88456 RepID=A0A1D3CRZ2_9EIME|nr:methyltransferase domain-containing protein [Cyclospora cayetanensis]